jgi:hypothetical protein
MSEINEKESRLNKAFWILSGVTVFALFRFSFFTELLVLLECVLIGVRFVLVRGLREQRKAIVREAEIQFANNIKAAEAAARKRHEDERKASGRNPDVRPAKDIIAEAAARKRNEDERKEAIAQQKKPVDPQSLNLDKSIDAQKTPASIEQIPNDFVSSIPCASDILKAQSVSFSPRAPGNLYGLADEMAKVGYRSIGDFYRDIQKIVTHEMEIATVVKKFDSITDNEYLRGTLTRLLYAVALGTAKPKDSDLKPLASALRTIVDSQKIVPRALGGPSSLEMAELLGAIVVTAVSRCQFGSASALVEHFKIATLSFADESISPDGPSNRRYVTALILCLYAMLFETSKSISIVTDSLAGNRLVPIDINQLGSIDFNYLNANRPGWLAEVIANSPELQRAYLRHLRDDE